MNPSTLTYPKTPEEAYAYFRAHGISIREWSTANNLPYAVVKDVLLQRSKGQRGTAHHVAVALGLKPNPEQVSTEV